MQLLRNFKFWNRGNDLQAADTSLPDPIAPATVEGFPPDAVAVPPAQAAEPTNVIQMPSRTPLDNPAGLAGNQDAAVPRSTTSQPKGLLDAPQIQAFFANNHFGLGQHNGCHFKTQDALHFGKQQLISKFQNALAELTAQCQAKVDRLQNMQLQTEGVCQTTSAQLKLACNKLERDMTALREQSALADEGKGWVLKSLNEYQAGFSKGVRVAVDFELLGQ